MKSITINEIEKDISLLERLTEVTAIMDENKTIATIHPLKQPSVVAALAGKYKKRLSHLS